MQSCLYYANEALLLVKKHKTCDPFQIAKEEGIKLVPVSFSKIYGAVVTIDNTTLIEYSSTLEEEEKRIVVAHELGHLYLHPQCSFMCILKNTLFYDSFEYQANIFAAALRLGDKFKIYANYLQYLASLPPSRFVHRLAQEIGPLME